MKKNKLSAVLACGITFSLPFMLTGCEAIDSMFDEGGSGSQNSGSRATYYPHNRQYGSHSASTSSSSSSVTTSNRSDGSRSYSGSNNADSSNPSISGQSAAVSTSNAADDPSSVVTTVKPKMTNSTSPTVPLEAPSISGMSQ